MSTTYGLDLLLNQTLSMVTPDGSVAASAPLLSSSPQISCSPNLFAAEQPPVSATADRVYFRDGETAIRYLTPDGKTGDATSVPGGPTTVSFFSVSPDDKRIAVLVEYLAFDPIYLRLYVEDVNGGGNHIDLYSTSTPRSAEGTTLWPMGWQQGRLVLALWPVCSSTGQYPGFGYPLAWHVVDPVTGNRLVSVGSNTCVPSYFPSPAGLTCFDYTISQINIYDWQGNLTATVPTSENAGYGLELSPSGKRIMYTPYPMKRQPSTTFIDVANPSAPWSFDGWPIGCMWIDDDHVQASSGVIDVKSTKVTVVPVSGLCAGRFPGTL